MWKSGEVCIAGEILYFPYKICKNAVIFDISFKLKKQNYIAPVRTRKGVRNVNLPNIYPQQRKASWSTKRLGAKTKMKNKFTVRSNETFFHPTQIRKLKADKYSHIQHQPQWWQLKCLWLWVNLQIKPFNKSIAKRSWFPCKMVYHMCLIGL